MGDDEQYVTYGQVFEEPVAGITRYDKLAANFLSGVALVTALVFWL